jgi:6-phosphogluconate dehydrogenase
MLFWRQAVKVSPSLLTQLPNVFQDVVDVVQAIKQMVPSVISAEKNLSMDSFDTAIANYDKLRSMRATVRVGQHMEDTEGATGHDLQQLMQQQQL